MRAPVHFGLSFAAGAFGSALLASAVLVYGLAKFDPSRGRALTLLSAVAICLAVSIVAAVISGVGAAVVPRSSRVPLATAAAGGLLFVAASILVHNLSVPEPPSLLARWLMVLWLVAGPFLIGSLFSLAFRKRGDV